MSAYRRPFELTDVEGDVVERPDRATVERAFAQVDRARGRRGKVSLRNAQDLVVTAQPAGNLRRIDLETGAVQELPAPAARARARGIAPTAGAALGARALEAIGRPDLR